MAKTEKTAAAGNQGCFSAEKSDFLSIRLIRVPWLIPSWARAQTWGRWILVRRDTPLTAALLAHELAHVEQWHTLGRLRFLWQYAWGLWRYGYWRHPLEQAARAAVQEPFYQAWAAVVLQQSGLARGCERS